MVEEPGEVILRKIVLPRGQSDAGAEADEEFRLDGMPYEALGQ